VYRLDYEEKQHYYDEQINHFKKLELSISHEGGHYQQLIKRYYELCDELLNAQNALKRLKQQRENISI
jgi:flagellar biosynthesis chaperone FliJ